MSGNPKQFTSIYKEGIQFSDIPISTGSNAVYMPKQIDKWTGLIANYENKAQHQKMKQLGARQPMEKYPGFQNTKEENSSVSDSKSSSSYSKFFFWANQ